jgi:hypothetical protein
MVTFIHKIHDVIFAKLFVKDNKCSYVVTKLRKEQAVSKKI